MIFTGVETVKNLDASQAAGLAMLGSEILRVAMNLPASDLRPRHGLSDECIDGNHPR